VTITPFADDSASTSIGELTIENGRDRMSIYGSLDITRDKRGLEDARRLQTVLAGVVRLLEGEGDQLSEKHEIKADVTRFRNPFG
jgi:hypothetical protein